MTVTAASGMSRADKTWHEDAERYGWRVDHLRAAWPWRVWGIRHARYAWHCWRAASHVDRCQSVGIGFGGLSQYDAWILWAIRRGWV